MPIFDTFWSRERKRRGETPDVYTYTSIPSALRVQIVHIMKDVIGGTRSGGPQKGAQSAYSSYEEVVGILRKEFGIFILPPTDYDDHEYFKELADFILNEPNVDKAMSAIELVCRVIDKNVSKYSFKGSDDAAAEAETALAEINQRIKAHGLGFEYVGEMIRIDAQHIHTEAVIPALRLLSDPRFKGADEEFRSAHGHYKSGHNKEALVDALKALESTLKTIFGIRKWAYKKTDTVSSLLKIAFDNGLVPPYWQSHYSGLRATLESGVPTVRNQTSGHGQGASPTVVPAHIVSYSLHMTASAVVFLVEAERALGK